jgi:hypothetical protein
VSCLADYTQKSKKSVIKKPYIAGPPKQEAVDEAFNQRFQQDSAKVGVAPPT